MSHPRYGNLMVIADGGERPRGGAEGRRPVRGTHEPVRANSRACGRWLRARAFRDRAPASPAQLVSLGEAWGGLSRPPPIPYRRSGATADCARSNSGAGITPSWTTPQSATTRARQPATDGNITVGAPSGSRMYMYTMSRR